MTVSAHQVTFLDLTQKTLETILAEHLTNGSDFIATDVIKVHTIRREQPLTIEARLTLQRIDHESMLILQIPLSPTYANLVISTVDSELLFHGRNISLSPSFVDSL
jgi:hypothetical protein